MPETRKPIVVVGSVTMDMVTCTPQIPRIGQTVIGTSFSTTPGGKGANQAVAAARLGYPVQFVGMVGDDVYGAATDPEPRRRRCRYIRNRDRVRIIRARSNISRRQRPERDRRCSRSQWPGRHGIRRQTPRSHPQCRNGSLPAGITHGHHRSHAGPLRTTRRPRDARSRASRGAQRSGMEAGRMVHSK